MRISIGAVTAAVALCIGFPAAAQNFGVLQSAETMDPGVYKLMVAPIVTLDKDGAGGEFGVGVRGGYGFTDRFDVELKLGVFENSTYVGVDGELWILKGREKDAGLDFSLAGGVHWAFGKNRNLDVIGLDLTPLFSGHATKNLELCGALDVSFEKVKDAPAGVDDTFTKVHVVPGLEYHLTDTADLVGEVGIGLNDNSYSYVGIGIAFYFR